MAAAAAIEAALGRLLALDPDSADRLRPLQDRVIALHWTDLGLRLYFLPGPRDLAVVARYDGAPDVLIEGTVTGFVGRFLGASTADQLFGGELRITGDSALAAAFQDLLRRLHFDWEEALARLVGDTLAHQAGRRLRQAGQQAERLARRTRADLSEYVREELRLAPDRAEVEDFLAAVDRLRLDCDRLAQRIERLERRLGGDREA